MSLVQNRTIVNRKNEKFTKRIHLPPLFLGISFIPTPYLWRPRPVFSPEMSKFYTEKWGTENTLCMFNKRKNETCADCELNFLPYCVKINTTDGASVRKGIPLLTAAFLRFLGIWESVNLGKRACKRICRLFFSSSRLSGNLYFYWHSIFFKKYEGQRDFCASFSE